MKIVTEEMKKEMLRLYDNGLGLSQVKIAKEFGLSESTVRYWLMPKSKRENVKDIARQKFAEYCEKRQLLKETKGSGFLQFLLSLT